MPVHAARHAFQDHPTPPHRVSARNRSCFKMSPPHSTSLHRQYQPSRPIPFSQQQSLPHQPSRRNRLSTLSISTIFTRPAMPSKFNIVRVSLYAVLLAWTIICLAIAAHFQSLLVITDLTRFVPFAIFVCSASLLILLVLLVCTALRARNPISTRIELGCLGLLGTFWLALGAFLASSDSENADVECYSSTDSSELVDVAGFSTETYQAQYRVLEAFSLFNVILVWGFLFFLLGMALKHYYRVNRNVWFIPVTIYPWFGPKSTMSKLPAPVGARSRGRTNTSHKADSELWKNGSLRKDSRYPSSGHATPARAYTVDNYKRSASPRR